MLKVLLKLFPASFVEHMGQEWLADTQAEWAQAREGGLLAMARCAGRTLAGSFQGAAIAHGHAIQMAWAKTQEQPHWVAVGGRVALLGKGHPQPAGCLWLALLGSAGAVLAGHLAFDLFLALWLGRVWETVPESFQARELGAWTVVALGPLLAKAAGVAFGVYIALAARVRSSLSLLSLSHLGSSVLLFVLAFSASHTTWILLDLGRISSVAAQVMEEYPVANREMGLASLEDEVTATPTQCQQAQAVFTLTHSRWVPQARQSGEGMGLFMLKAMGAQMWRRGCWDDAQLLENNLSLVEASRLTPHNQRRLAIHLPQLNQAQAFVTHQTILTREGLCGMKVNRASGGSLRQDKVQAFCENIPHAQASVHDLGTFEPTQEQIARLMMAE